MSLYNIYARELKGGTGMKEWSNYQKAIFDIYENTEKNIIIGATAGSSKTTCLVEMSKRTSPSKRLLFMAFNKSIAKELESRLKDGIEVATFHSKGLKLLLSSFTFKMKLVENKCFNITTKRLKLDDIFPNQQMRYHFELQEVWNQVRVNLIENYEEDILLICIEKDIEFRERMIEDIKLINKEWEKGMEVLRKGTSEFPIDFTDMIYLPYKMIPSEKFKKYDVVMTDELQDVNVLQKEFILNCIKRRGRFVGCGDFAQAIYSFQGASTDNFRSFQELPNTITLPLSISYRCAKKIIEEAKMVFGGGIESSPTAGEGIVRRGELKEANEGDFVLCRNNLPLVQAFVYFLSMKKKVTIKGKDLGNAIVRMLEEVEDIKDIDFLLEEKLKDLEKKGVVGKAAKNNPTYISLEEKCSIVKVLNKVWPNIRTLKNMLNEVFTEKLEGIVLSTIHKSKGLEADRVFFLNQELIPSARAITEKAKYAEKCLRFVAITRAKKELIYCNI